MSDDAREYCPARDDAEGWREEALAARAALYLLKVAAARPDLTPQDAWRREHMVVSSHMTHGASAIGDAEWISWDWRRDTLLIAAHPDAHDARHVVKFRARVMALLNDQ